MPFPFDKYPWLNFQELNLAYFIKHFREIFEQWNTLLNEMYEWKDATDEELAEWKSTVETGISSWETGLQQSMEDWKDETEADISTWEAATLSALDAWKTATTVVFEQIRTEAAASAQAAAESASSAQTALAGAQAAQAAAEAAAAGIQSELAQIQTNTSDISDLKTQLIDFTKYETVTGWADGFIPTNTQVGNTVNINDVRQSTTYKYVIVPCNPGEVFTITASGGTTARVFCVMDSNYTVKAIATTIQSNGLTDYHLTIPADGAWILLHKKADTENAYKGIYTNVDIINQKINSDSAIEGNAMRDFVGFKPITDWKTGYIPSNIAVGGTIDLSDWRYNANIKYTLLPCSAGQKYTISGLGTTNGRIYCIIDENNVVLDICNYANSVAGIEHYNLTIPTGGIYLLLHNTDDNAVSYYGTFQALTKSENLPKKVIPSDPHILDYDTVNIISYAETDTDIDITKEIDGYFGKKFTIGTSTTNIELSSNIPVITDQNIAEILITVEDPSVINLLRLYLTFDGSIYRYSFGDINQTPFTNQAYRLRVSLYNEYNPDATDNYANASAAKRADLENVKLSISTTSGSTNIYLHAINLLHTKPYFNICCDGNWESVYTLAFPEMEKRGIKGTAYIECRQVDAPTEEGHMSMAQIDDLAVHGWDIASHTYYHRHMDGIQSGSTPYKEDPEENEAYIAEDLAKARKWLIDREFWRGCNFVAGPAGRYKREWFDMYGEYCKVVRAGEGTGGYVFPSEIGAINKCALIYYKSIGSVNYGPSVLEPLIDQAIERGKSMNINMHIIKESGATGTVQYNLADLQEILDYLVAKRDAGLCYVGRISDLFFNGHGNIKFNAIKGTASIENMAADGVEFTDLTI